MLISTERAARKGGELPEDIGRETALQLLEEVWKGGVIDSTHQPLVLILMVLGPEDVSKVSKCTCIHHLSCTSLTPHVICVRCGV